jgi:hypothetical protein
MPLPPTKTGVRLALEPTVMVVGLAKKLLTAGRGMTVTVAV